MEEEERKRKFSVRSLGGPHASSDGSRLGSRWKHHQTLKHSNKTERLEAEKIVCQFYRIV